MDADFSQQRLLRIEGSGPDRGEDLAHLRTRGKLCSNSLVLGKFLASGAVCGCVCVRVRVISQFAQTCASHHAGIETSLPSANPSIRTCENSLKDGPGQSTQ